MHEIHRMGNRSTIGLRAEARAQIETLKSLAMIAVLEQGWVMPPQKAFLGVRYTMYCAGLNSGDIDNGAASALDAFQGIVYFNDMYIVEISGKKVLKDKKDLLFQERTEFEIYVITKD